MLQRHLGHSPLFFIKKSFFLNLPNHIGNLISEKEHARNVEHITRHPTSKKPAYTQEKL